MRSNSSMPPRASLRDSSIFPRRSRFSKMLSAGGQVPTQMEAPASAIALAMAKPKPPSSATPATSARLPERSMGSMSAISRAPRRDASRADRVRCAPHAPLGLDDGRAGARRAGRRHRRRGGRRQRDRRRAGAARRFLILAFAFLFDLPLQRASADAKPVNFASNLAALALFSVRGTVLWEIAL